MIFFSDFTNSRSFERFQNSSENKPLTNRIHRLPPRYSEHYFTVFRPNIETETKTNFTYPTNAVNFFGPQSYWGQFANRLVNNVVGQIGGVYVKKSEKSAEFKQALKDLAKSDTNSSTETLEKFKKALKMENSAMWQKEKNDSNFDIPKNYISVEDVGKEDTKSIEQMSSEIEQYEEPRIVDFVRPKKNNTKQFFVTNFDQKINLAEIIQPTRAPILSSTLKSSSFENTDYGILPNLLLKNPNARNRFYHLEKYANPQFPISKIFNFEKSKSEIKNPSIIVEKTNLQEIRRSPLHNSFERIHQINSKSKETSREWDSISNEIRFRSALKNILSNYRKEHSINNLPNWLKERQLERLTQRKSNEINIRRHPGNHRRTVFLPARYESGENFARWRH